MATDAEIMHQLLEPLAIGETADQTFTATFDFDPTGTAFTFTLSSKPGRTAALILTTGDDEVELEDVTEDDGVYTATITVHYVTEDTEDLAAGDYAFDLWDMTNDARVAAGVQPVVTPARKDV
jgi:hypothetical protein